MIGVLDSVEAFIVSPLEKLYRLEIEFHRRLRTVAPGIIDASSQHTSYALQTGYEQLIRATGTVTPHDVETLRERFILEGEGIRRVALGGYPPQGSHRSVLAQLTHTAPHLMHTLPWRRLVVTVTQPPASMDRPCFPPKLHETLPPSLPRLP